MKRNYLSRLEGWARWRLPRQEAEDVLADYRDIVGTPPRSEEELIRDLGQPRDVIRPLAEQTAYRKWLAAFAAMAACAFIPGQTGFGIFAFRGYRLCFEKGGLHLGLVFALLGMVLALVWFRREKDAPKTPVPKGVIITSAILLIWIGLVFLFHWAILYDLDGFIAMWGMTQVWPGPIGDMEPRTVFLSKWGVILLPHLATYFALYWLVKARVSDRRWAAVYILALTAITISLETSAEMMSMDVTAPYDYAIRFFANLIKCAVITAIGLAGAGVSLYCTLPHLPPRKQKPLTKKDYMTRLSRAARWMLPHQEADDVIADYQEIVADEGLLQGLGRPKNVIRPLADTRAYRTWLAVFTVTAVCILAPGVSGSPIGFGLWLYLFDGFIQHPYGAYIAALGAVTALVWFRWKGQKEVTLPRTIPILLAVLLACIGYVLWFCWAASRDVDAFLEMWGTVKVWIGPNDTAPASFHLSRVAMGDVSAVIALLGVYSLVRARTGDRRWAAVYVLAVTTILVALLTVDWSGRMDPTGSTYEALFRQMLTRCSLITAAGLVGTGVALC